jgi:predicted porin
MKRSIVLAAAALATPASFAQSSVQLSGIADAAARQVANSGLGSVKSLVSGSNSTSRIVIRGTEDLGGGLTAGFHLEHGIALDTGLPTGGFWDRRSTVSVAHRSAGELRLGRDFVPSYAGWSRFDPFSYVGVAGSNNLVSATPNGPIRSAFGTNPNTTVRSSNAVQYFLPGGLAGVEGGLMVAAGEGGTALNGQHKVFGARLGWAGAGAVLSLATTSTENNLTTAGKFKDTAIGASYAFSFMRLSAAWRRFEQASSEQTNTMLAFSVPFGVHEIKGSFVRAEFGGNVGATALEANGADQLGLGYVYNLSKRSALYGTYSRLTNDGGVAYVIPGGPAGMASGGTSVGYEAGIRHSF